MNRLRYALPLVALLVATSPLPAPVLAQEAAPLPQYPGATVVRVVDGDTVDVTLPDGGQERLRLIGMDTPETVDPRRPVQCYGAEASAHAKTLLPEGQAVTLQLDPSQGQRDRYGRLLAYVLLPDGANFAQAMIGAGYAHEYTYRLPYAYQPDFQAAATAARDAGVGLWAPETCAGLAYPEAPAEAQAAHADLADGQVAGNFVYSGPYDPAGPDRDCGDFTTWHDAQAFFLAAGGPTTDRHRLDGGGIEGIVCESLTGSPAAR